MATKIITVNSPPPAESTGSDYNKGAPLSANEHDQNIINLRAAVDRRALKSGTVLDDTLTVNTDSLVVTDDGNVLIGTTTDNGTKMRVVASSSGVTYTRTDLAQTVFEAAANAGIALLTGTNGICRILFDDAGNGSGGSIAYLNNGNTLLFATADSEKMRITGSGNVLIGTTTDAGTGKLQVAGNIGLTNATITASASSGSNGAVPGQVAAYLSISINGSTYKIPVFNV